MTEQIILDGCRPIFLDDVEMTNDGGRRDVFGTRRTGVDFTGLPVRRRERCIDGDEPSESLPELADVKARCGTSSVVFLEELHVWELELVLGDSNEILTLIPKRGESERQYLYTAIMINQSGETNQSIKNSTGRRHAANAGSGRRYPRTLTDPSGHQLRIEIMNAAQAIHMLAEIGCQSAARAPSLENKNTATIP